MWEHVPLIWATCTLKFCDSSNQAGVQFDVSLDGKSPNITTQRWMNDEYLLTIASAAGAFLKMSPSEI